MNSKFLKWMMVSVFAISCITIPSVSYAEETVLTDFNASAITPGEYTMAELSAEMTTGTVIQPSYDNYYTDVGNITVADGVATFGAAGSSKEIEPTFMFGQTVTKGVVTFDFEVIKTNLRNDEWFGILDASGNRKIIFEPEVVNGNVYLNFGHGVTNERKYGLLHGSTFNGGSDMYYKSINHDTDKSMNTRLILSRRNETSDWAVKVYDLDVSAETTIFDGTISKDALNGITGSYTTVYVNSTSTVRKIQSWKATLSQMQSASLSLTEDKVDVAGNIEVVFPEAITPSLSFECKLWKLGGAEPVEIPAEASWSSDKTKLIVNPLSFLEENANYKLSFTGAEGVAYAFDDEFTFTTSQPSLKLTGVAYTGEGGAPLVSPVGATQVTVTATVDGFVDGAVGGVLGIYKDGKLVKVITQNFRQNAEFSVTYTGEALPEGTTVTSFVAHKAANGKITAIYE